MRKKRKKRFFQNKRIYLLLFTTKTHERRIRRITIKNYMAVGICQRSFRGRLMSVRLLFFSVYAIIFDTNYCDVPPKSPINATPILFGKTKKRRRLRRSPNAGHAAPGPTANPGLPAILFNLSPSPDSTYLVRSYLPAQSAGTERHSATLFFFL